MLWNLNYNSRFYGFVFSMVYFSCFFSLSLCLPLRINLIVFQFFFCRIHNIQYEIDYDSVEWLCIEWILRYNFWDGFCCRIVQSSVCCRFSWMQIWLHVQRCMNTNQNRAVRSICNSWASLIFGNKMILFPKKITKWKQKNQWYKSKLMKNFF